MPRYSCRAADVLPKASHRFANSRNTCLATCCGLYWWIVLDIARVTAVVVRHNWIKLSISLLITMIYQTETSETIVGSVRYSYESSVILDLICYPAVVKVSRSPPTLEAFMGRPETLRGGAHCVRDQTFSILTSVDHYLSAPHRDSYHPHNHTKSSHMTVHRSTDITSDPNM